ncbi:MAG: peptidylprolyl isomerase [Planctomycetes bacterium]|nr:peptidylprolyl isomerase [Planctomycetota bacterium]
MSALPPSPEQGIQAPNAITLLWERYRSLAYVVVLALLAAMGLHYFLRYQQQKEVDGQQTEFVTSIGLEGAYENSEKIFDLQDSLGVGGGGLDRTSVQKLEALLPKATEAQKPYVLMALARKAMSEKNWERAESALDQLEKGFPGHLLVAGNDYPVQARREAKRDEETPLPPGKRPELMPVQAGSQVALLRQQIATGKSFTLPPAFSAPAIPADATKVRIETTRGAFVIALMPQAKAHSAAFLKLLESQPSVWEGVAIDEVRRATKNSKQPSELHFGFESTKSEKLDEWTSAPSTTPIEFEETGLSHFAGAVSGRPEAEGKSSVDRMWITLDDNPFQDGERVVFGYVTEGLEVLRTICGLPFSSQQEEERGSGRLQDVVRIVKVTKL